MIKNQIDENIYNKVTEAVNLLKRFIEKSTDNLTMARVLTENV